MSIAKLKALRSRKPIPPLFLGEHSFPQLIQWIFFLILRLAPPIFCQDQTNAIIHHFRYFEGAHGLSWYCLGYSFDKGHQIAHGPKPDPEARWPTGLMGGPAHYY